MSDNEDVISVSDEEMSDKDKGEVEVVKLSDLNKTIDKMNKDLKDTVYKSIANSFGNIIVQNSKEVDFDFLFKLATEK